LGGGDGAEGRLDRAGGDDLQCLRWSLLRGLLKVSQDGLQRGVECTCWGAALGNSVTFCDGNREENDGTEERQNCPSTVRARHNPTPSEFPLT
jgi:hypothetical protein